MVGQGCGDDGTPPEREPEPEPGPAREADGFEAGLDAAWVEFAGLLEVALRGLGEGFVAIDLPEVGGEIPTMVFVGVDGGVRATLGAGDDDLPLGAVVADAQRPVLRALGWGIGPKGLFASLNPRRTPAAIAATAVVTAREVFGVVHPSFLTTANFGPDDGPEPEVDGEGVTADVRGPAHLAALVDAALAQRLPGRPERDRDGDVVLDLGRATGYVRVAPDCAYVSVFTPLLYDVPGDALVLERLNQLNKSWRMVRFTWAGGIVTATLDLWCSPFVPELLRNGLDGMAAVVAELPDLQLRLGGRAYGWVDEE